MGASLSSPSPTNPTSSDNPEPPTATSSPTMSSPNLETKTLEEEKDSEENSKEEEEGECGFCVFMKGGGCKEAFIEWENCVMEGEAENVEIVDKCHEVTFRLKTCMEAHAEYYEPILKAEKTAKEEVAKEIEKEKKEKVLEQSGGDGDKKNDDHERVN